MRWNEHPRDFAIDLARVVLPIPGTSSKRTCPSQSNATISRSITSSLPTITRPTFWRIERAASCTWRISSVCVMGGALSFTARRSLVFLAQYHALELYAQKEMNFTHHRNQRFVQIQAGIVLVDRSDLWLLLPLWRGLPLSCILIPTMEWWHCRHHRSYVGQQNLCKEGRYIPRTVPRSRLLR